MGQLNVELIDCFLTGLLFSSIIYTIIKEIKFCKIDCWHIPYCNKYDGVL